MGTQFSFGQTQSIRLDQKNFLPTVYPFISSVEGEVQLGFGGGSVGLMGKANHTWIWGGNLFLFSGVSLSSFVGSESYNNPPTAITGTSFDTHLRLHTGGQFEFFRGGRAYISLEIFGGIYHFRTKGTYTQTDLGIDRAYKTSKIYGDFGSRFTAGYNIKKNWAVQASLTNSWKQAAFGLGWPVGLLAGEPDGKTSIGIGVRYSFPEYIPGNRGLDN